MYSSSHMLRVSQIAAYCFKATWPASHKRGGCILFCLVFGRSCYCHKAWPPYGSENLLSICFSHLAA